MKAWRVVALASFAIIVLTLALIAATPLRFPGSLISWRPFLVFLSPSVVILLLLAARPRVRHTRFTRALIGAAILFAAMALLKLMAAPVLALALVSLVAMLLASRALPEQGLGQ
jgi:hypothetical protein